MNLSVRFPYKVTREENCICKPIEPLNYCALFQFGGMSTDNCCCFRFILNDQQTKNVQFCSYFYQLPSLSSLDLTSSIIIVIPVYVFITALSHNEILSLSFSYRIFCKICLVCCLFLMFLSTASHWSLFGFYHRFLRSTGHITTGSFIGRGNQYVQLVKVLYCKRPIISKILLSFPHGVGGFNCRPQRWEVSMLPLCHLTLSVFLDIE